MTQLLVDTVIYALIGSFGATLAILLYNLIRGGYL